MGAVISQRACETAKKKQVGVPFAISRLTVVVLLYIPIYTENSITLVLDDYVISQPPHTPFYPKYISVMVYVIVMIMLYRITIVTGILAEIIWIYM